jgi:hypothetical protein
VHEYATAVDQQFAVHDLAVGQFRTQQLVDRQPRHVERRGPWRYQLSYHQTRTDSPDAATNYTNWTAYSQPPTTSPPLW